MPCNFRHKNKYFLLPAKLKLRLKFWIFSQAWIKHLRQSWEKGDLTWVEIGPETRNLTCVKFCPQFFRHFFYLQANLHFISQFNRTINCLEQPLYGSIFGISEYWYSDILCKIVWFTLNKWHSKLVKTTKPDLHGTLGLLAIAELFRGIFSHFA